MSSSFNGKLADPEWRKARAIKASRAAHSLDTHVRRVVERAPDLSPEQLDRLRAILRPAGSNSDPAIGFAATRVDEPQEAGRG